MPTVTTAAVCAVTALALYAGHQVGDHIVQLPRDVEAKGLPRDDRLAAGVHPFTGWGACLRHVSTYLATQAVALLLVSLAAPIGWRSMVTALIVSGSTHAVIDRRWIVRLVVRSRGCQEWAEGPYLIDQTLHVAAMFVAAVATATVTSPVGLAVVAGAGGLLVPVALLVEGRLAAAAISRPGDPFRM
jgi:hypothetical protein